MFQHDKKVISFRYNTPRNIFINYFNITGNKIGSSGANVIINTLISSTSIEGIDFGSITKHERSIIYLSYKLTTKIILDLMVSLKLPVLSKILLLSKNLIWLVISCTKFYTINFSSPRKGTKLEMKEQSSSENLWEITNHWKNLLSQVSSFQWEYLLLLLLFENNIGSSAINELVESLKSNTTITELSLNDTY